MSIFALGNYQGPELNPAPDLISWLTPVIVWVVGLVIKPIVKVPGWLMLSVVVPLLSLAISWLSEQLGLNNLPFWLQFVYGFGAVFLDQLKKKISESVS